MTKPITDRPLLQAARVPKPYNEEIATEICRRLSQGESLRAICEDKHMPSNQMIYRWMADEPTFRSAFARARLAPWVSCTPAPHWGQCWARSRSE